MDVALQTDILIDRFDLAAVRAIRNQVHDALLGRAQLPIQINQRSRDGSSSAGILVSTIDDAEGILLACQAAIKQLDPDATSAVNPASLASTTAHNYRPVLA